LPRHGLISRLTVVTPTRLWLSFDFGTVIGSTDAGRNWFTSRIGQPENGAGQLFFLDSKHGWATTSTTLYRTTDGIHWKRISHHAQPSA
jgi:photosystem II stability/assembly factor-like uncharacterized protein